MTDPYNGQSGSGVYIQFGSSKERLCIWQALGRSNSREAELSAVQSSLSWLLGKWKEKRLGQYEVLKVISDSRYASNLLIKKKKWVKNKREIRETADLMKRASRKFKIRWSYVEAHPGILGNQVAKNLAWKGVGK